MKITQAQAMVMTYPPGEAPLWSRVEGAGDPALLAYLNARLDDPSPLDDLRPLPGCFRNAEAHTHLLRLAGSPFLDRLFSGAEPAFLVRIEEESAGPDSNS